MQVRDSDTANLRTSIFASMIAAGHAPVRQRRSDSMYKSTNRMQQRITLARARLDARLVTGTMVAVPWLSTGSHMLRILSHRRALALLRASALLMLSAGLASAQEQEADAGRIRQRVVMDSARIAALYVSNDPSDHPVANYAA